MSVRQGGKIIAGRAESISHNIGEVFPAPFTDTWIPKGAVPANGQEYERDRFPDFFDNWLGKVTDGKVLWYGFTHKFSNFYTKVEHPELNPNEPLYEILSNGTFEITYTWDEIVGMSGDTPVRAPELDIKETTITGGRVRTCTYEEFDAEVAKSGGCAKYAVNGNNFKVPLIGEGVYLAGGNGESFAESLPNILADVTSEDTSYGGAVQGYKPKFTGALKKSTRGKSSGWSGSTDATFELRFDASDSNPVYQNGAKVHPNTVTVAWFCQLSNGEINKSDMDWAQWQADLQGKANKDLSNVVFDQEFVNRVNNWGIPDYSAGVSKQKGVTYTAEFSGRLICQTTEYYSGGGVDYIEVNGVVVSVSTYSNTGWRTSMFADIEKGDTYKITKGSGETGWSYVFYPYRGDK